ncbi:APC family permease [Brachyspira murdochii]|uniref:Arginine/agmatine antiporter n=1 Tax=Brachyspira murdochii (strain ATCC 51284 / DSM 12563 / 56-150) TaxID=526224 RepID=D5U762_BRAM5|nr:APC family permease [Brachyspira murdochii]ADG72786.1 amino acid permease-associated region [Brachyspira murdochii DSM 12563]
MSSNKLGLFSIVLLGINAIVGTGIFLLPNQAYAEVGVTSIGVIVFDAFLVISIALCFAEMGGMYKNNGGPYLYAKDAFGDFVGFEVGIMKWAISIIAWAAMAMGFPTALGAVWAPAQNPAVQKIIAITILVLLGIMNIMGVKISKIMNNIVTTGKLIPLILFVTVGIFFIKGENFVNPVSESGEVLLKGTFGSAALLIFYAFTGFESIGVAAGDMDNAKKNVPLAICIVLILVAIIYILIQVNSIGILGASLATTSTPVATAAEKFLGKWAGAMVTAGTLISIGGINIASSFLTPRAGVAMSDEHQLPSIISKRNSKDVPYVAVIISVVLTALVTLTGSFTTLAAISVVSRFAQYIPTCLAVPVMRKKAPDMERGFVLPFGPVIPIIATVVSLWLLSQSDLKKIIFGLGGLVIGAVVYFIMKISNKK